MIEAEFRHIKRWDLTPRSAPNPDSLDVHLADPQVGSGQLILPAFRPMAEQSKVSAATCAALMLQWHAATIRQQRFEQLWCDDFAILVPSWNIQAYGN